MYSQNTKIINRNDMEEELQSRNNLKPRSTSVLQIATYIFQKFPIITTLYVKINYSQVEVCSTGHKNI